MNQTPNYALNQWEPGDQVLRADFNADNAKLDAALGALASRIECGTYVGNGRHGGGASNATALHLGYQPKLLLVGGGENAGVFVNPATRTDLFTPANCKTVYVQWLEDGVQWYVLNSTIQDAGVQLNAQGVTYHYVAFR